MPTVSVQIATVESGTTAAGSGAKQGGSDNLTRDSSGIASMSCKMGKIRLFLGSNHTIQCLIACIYKMYMRCTSIMT